MSIDVSEKMKFIFDELANRSDTYFGVYRIGDEIVSVSKFSHIQLLLDIVEGFEDDFILSIRQGSLDDLGEGDEQTESVKCAMETQVSNDLNQLPSTDSLEFCSTDELYGKIQELNIDVVLLSLQPERVGEDYELKAWVWKAPDSSMFALVGMLRIGRQLTLEKFGHQLDEIEASIDDDDEDDDEIEDFNEFGGDEE